MSKVISLVAHQANTDHNKALLEIAEELAEDIKAGTLVSCVIIKGYADTTYYRHTSNKSLNECIGMTQRTIVDMCNDA